MAQYLCKTMTGEGSGPVHILYTPHEDGVELDALMAPCGFSLDGYFYDDELLKFKEACQKHYDEICADSRFEAAVSAFESRQDMVTA